MSENALPSDPDNDRVPMTVAGITLDKSINMPIVILKDDEDQIAIPIWIGLVEASAIATELEGIQLARPMTHDLLRSVLESLGGVLTHIVVNDLRDNTFFASLFISSNGQVMEVDARPSDAIALALRCKALIYVARKVIEASQLVEPAVLQELFKKAQQQGEDGEHKNIRDRWTELLENLKPEDFGKYKM